MGDIIPSADALLALCSSTVQLHEQLRLYRRLLADEPTQVSSLEPGLLFFNMFASISGVEKWFNPRRQPFPPAEGLACAGWNMEVYSAIYWIKSATYGVIEIFRIQGICEDKSISLYVAGSDSDKGTGAFNEKSCNVFVPFGAKWPDVDDRLMVRLEEALRILARNLAGNEAKAADKTKGATHLTEGEWSAPMSKSEMARRITGRRKARAREVASFLEPHEIKSVGGNKWIVRLDKMDANNRRKLETN